MKVLITGDRGFWTKGLIVEAIKRSGFTPTHLITGLGPGIEWGALRWAINNGLRTIGFDIGPYLHGENPEIERVTDMVKHSDAVIIVSSQKSSKVNRIKALANLRDIPIFCMEFKREEW